MGWPRSSRGAREWDREVKSSAARAELAKHRQVISHGPTLGDLTVVEAVHGGEPPAVITGASLDAHELAAVPATVPDAVLDDVVALSDDDQLSPAFVGHLASSHRFEELACSRQAGRSAWRDGVVDHVWAAQSVQRRQVDSAQQGVELREHSLVLGDPHFWFLSFMDRRSRAAPASCAYDADETSPRTTLLPLVPIEGGLVGPPEDRGAEVAVVEGLSS